MSSQFVTLRRCSGNMHVWHIHLTYPARPAMQILPGQENETCTSTTTPIHRRRHVYVVSFGTFCFLSTIMDSFLSAFQTATRAAQTTIFENARPAAGRTGGAWNCENPSFLGLTQCVAEHQAGTRFAYKYAARATDCASTSFHFACSGVRMHLRASVHPSTRSFEYIRLSRGVPDPGEHPCPRPQPHSHIGPALTSP
jgi:hypothetical protein